MVMKFLAEGQTFGYQIFMMSGKQMKLKNFVRSLSIVFVNNK